MRKQNRSVIEPPEFDEEMLQTPHTSQPQQQQQQQQHHSTTTTTTTALCADYKSVPVRLTSSRYHRQHCNSRSQQQQQQQHLKLKHHLCITLLCLSVLISSVSANLQPHAAAKSNHKSSDKHHQPQQQQQQQQQQHHKQQHKSQQQPQQQCKDCTSSENRPPAAFDSKNSPNPEAKMSSPFLDPASGHAEKLSHVHHVKDPMEIFTPSEDHYTIKSCLSPDLEMHELSTCRFYAMMIDAGSTGTRIHIFEFSHQPNSTGSPFKLVKETFEETKPGLSSFANEPEKAAESVAILLNKAREIVPEQSWKHTPLALKATAGLRLLPENEAEAILDHLEQLFDESPFLVNEESVAVMSGVDEGIFGWFTLNFLLDRIDSVLLDPEVLLNAVSENWTAGALDLGGGSTQVTFRPLQSTTVRTAPEGFVKPVGVFSTEVQLYTHSYLGNGLVAARLGILRGSTKPTPKATNNQELYTACMPPDVSLRWNYSGTVWSVRGTKRYSADSCAQDVLKFVEASGIDKQAELGTRDLYAFSYFYDRGMQTKLVPQTSGGYTTVRDFRKAAQKSCARRQQDFGPEHWQVWQCLDLTYIHALLHYGYGLEENKQIYLAKKLRGLETSWALGAAYHLLNTYHEQQQAARSTIGIDVNADPSNPHSNYTYVHTVYEYVANLLEYFQLIGDRADSKV